ncbi:MAG: tRNA-intron lyase [Candidatus Thermoplasmatota archaeon]|jgi:tRNA-intron endonuclease|nr:tRNA-intron lyase [Candidatus Thermoplasmatota archaeon]MDP7264288.1 tRNA-intron lyase [Candidatus Thermoplasmatota archaeon]
MTLPVARIFDEHKAVVIDKEDGNRLYGKHCFGQPLSGGGTALTLIEAAYLVERNKLSVIIRDRPVDFSQLIDFIVSQTDTDFHRYVAYRDLKNRGFIVKFTSPFDFSLYPGGSSIRRNTSRKYVDVFSERHRFMPDAMYGKTLKSRELRKIYLVQIVDEEGDVTYYEISITDPRGKIPHISPGTKVKGILLEGSLIVFDKEKLRDLFEREFFGQVRESTHQLSLVEAAFLLKKNILEVSAKDPLNKNGELGGSISFEQFMEHGEKYESDLSERYLLYEELKRRDLIVKTGFKYGAYFRAYRDDPEENHAEYLFHLLSSKTGKNWPDISRSVRVAHGVRKKMIFVFPGIDEKMKYLMVQRVKPSC